MTARTSSKSFTLLFIMLGILLIMGLYIASQIETQTRTIIAPQPYHVKVNPYLAAELFLKKQNKTVSVKKNLAIFNSSSNQAHTVLLLGINRPLSALQNRQILKWVEQGGSLIIEANIFSQKQSLHSQKNLLDYLGIKLLQQQVDKYNSKDLLTRLYIEDGSPPALLNFAPYRHLEDTKNKAYTWANSPNNTTHIMQLRHGRGLITVVSDANIWKNSQIDQYDHAWLLDYLTTTTNITFINLDDMRPLTRSKPSPLKDLISNFAYSLAIISLFIILYLWHKGTRHGPIEPSISRDRRHLPEYLNASANFLIKHFGQQELISCLQKDIQYRAKRRQIGFEKLSLENQWKILSRLCNKPSHAIAKAMRPLAPKQKLSSLEFTKTVIALQEIRNNL